ncbi:hypothetical protein OGAPHI_006753 [Ogataea philodendri]|uniref:Uncharacterized protein n=1 Tax=Ogataea philodendri TaxID=1378263 RepID=A0A9P8NY35_9ASCO|nr:uncharacterized protein OGAPHI_006753 [Ogataea philodendri]KAH3661346.1 hypothetical protein OGAPHI_006753 [Ogataea philodendri]
MTFVDDLAKVDVPNSGPLVSVVTSTVLARRSGAMLSLSGTALVFVVDKEGRALEFDEAAKEGEWIGVVTEGLVEAPRRNQS